MTQTRWKQHTTLAQTNISGSTFYTEHGTHVSGIIAGRGKNNTDYAVTGVAPLSGDLNLADIELKMGTEYSPQPFI